MQQNIENFLSAIEIMNERLGSRSDNFTSVKTK